MASGEFTPDSLARRLFIITLLGVIAYIAVVLLLLQSPEKTESEHEDYGITVARLHP